MKNEVNTQERSIALRNRFFFMEMMKDNAELLVFFPVLVTLAVSRVYETITAPFSMVANMFIYIPVAIYFTTFWGYILVGQRRIKKWFKDNGVVL